MSGFPKTVGASIPPWNFIPANPQPINGLAGYYLNPTVNSNRSTATGLNQLNAYPVFSGPDGCTIDALDTNVVALYGAGGVIRAGIYQLVNQARPFAYWPGGVAAVWATLLVDAGTIATDGSTGRKIWTLSPTIVIPANTWFAIAGVEQVNIGTGTRTIGGSNPGFSPLGVGNASSAYSSTNGFGLLNNTNPAGALPSTFTPLSPVPSNIDCGIGYHRLA